MLNDCMYRIICCTNHGENVQVISYIYNDYKTIQYRYCRT